MASLFEEVGGTGFVRGVIIWLWCELRAAR
jgi:hypothetical protein